MKTSIENNRKLIELYFNEVWNQGKLEYLDSIIDPDYVNHNPGTANPPPGPKGLKPIIEHMRTGIPDLTYNINRTIITDDYIVAHVTVSGTHQNILFGIPPTGKKFEVGQINIERVKNGKLIEHWRITEDLKMMTQLGVVGSQG